MRKPLRVPVKADLNEGSQTISESRAGWSTKPPSHPPSQTRQDAYLRGRGRSERGGNEVHIAFGAIHSPIG